MKDKNKMQWNVKTFNHEIDRRRTIFELGKWNKTYVVFKFPLAYFKTYDMT